MPPQPQGLAGIHRPPQRTDENKAFPEQGQAYDHHQDSLHDGDGLLGHRRVLLRLEVPLEGTIHAEGDPKQEAVRQFPPPLQDRAAAGQDLHLPASVQLGRRTTALLPQLHRQTVQEPAQRPRQLAQLLRHPLPQDEGYLEGEGEVLGVRRYVQDDFGGEGPGGCQDQVQLGYGLRCARE